jgi:hypothetical protein
VEDIAREDTGRIRIGQLFSLAEKAEPQGSQRNTAKVAKESEVVKHGSFPGKSALIGAAILGLLASPLLAMAQSCALCYTQAASAGGRMIEALKSGILILIVPPTLMSIFMVFIMYRNRTRCRDTAGTRTPM